MATKHSILYFRFQSR